jgi:hypothetical protein
MAQWQAQIGDSQHSCANSARLAAPSDPPDWVGGQSRRCDIARDFRKCKGCSKALRGIGWRQRIGGLTEIHRAVARNGSAAALLGTLAGILLAAGV